jgi:hypothetical protein
VAGGQAWEAASAQHRAEGDARAVQIGETRLHARREVPVGDEDRGPAAEPRHEHLVTGSRGQRTDGGDVEAVQGASLYDLHRGPEDLGHLGDHVGPRGLADGDEAEPLAHQG